MKQTFTCSLDEQTVARIRKATRESVSFRNKSHLVEAALLKFLEVLDDDA